MIFFVGRNLQNTYIKERYVYLIDVLLYFALDRGCTMIDDGWSNGRVRLFYAKKRIVELRYVPIEMI